MNAKNIALTNDKIAEKCLKLASCASAIEKFNAVFKLKAAPRPKPK